MSEQIDAQLLIDALTEQRNKALDAAALAMARSVHFRRENERLREELAALKSEQPAS